MMSILDTTPEVAPRGAATLLLLDADYLAYMIGGISQSKDRDLNISGQELVCLDEATDLYVWIDPLPLVQWRLENELDKLKDRFDSDNLEAWLTPDKGNFRYDIAKSRPYKSGRSSIRPYHYRSIRESLLSIHGGQIAVGCEADDMVCTRQMDVFLSGSTDSVIIGPDKDLKCMFGLHYDPRKDVEQWITWQEAALNFYGQMITGDSVDSIPGCKGRGPKYWEGILSESQGYEDQVGFVHNRVWSTYTHKGHGFDYFLEQANLLHMRRSEGEEWTMDYNWEAGYVSQY